MPIVRGSNRLSMSGATDFFAGGGFFGAVRARKIVYLAFRLVLGHTVAFLNLANELIALPANHLEIIVCQLAPLRLNLSDRLLPLPFDLVPVHGNLLFSSSGN